MILFGSILLLLSLSSFTILRGLAASSPSPPVTLLTPTLEYHFVSGDSQIIATLVLGNGCSTVSDWGTAVESRNRFSASVTVVDVAGPSTACTAVVTYSQHTYSLGLLPEGNYSFALTACIVFPSYNGTVDCSNKTSMVFRISNPGTPNDDVSLLEYQDASGNVFVNSTITVPPCFIMRGWSDHSQSGNSFNSKVTIVDDTRLMIPCIAENTLAHNSYNLGHLAPGLYGFTLNLCEVIIRWGTTSPDMSSDCSHSRTIFFVVPGNPTPQPLPPKEWYMIFGPFAIIIIILLRLLRIPIS